MKELKDAAQQYFWQMGGDDENHYVIRLKKALNNIKENKNFN